MLSESLKHAGGSPHCYDTPLMLSHNANRQLTVRHTAIGIATHAATSTVGAATLMAASYKSKHIISLTAATVPGSHSRSPFTHALLPRPPLKGRPTRTRSHPLEHVRQGMRDIHTSFSYLERNPQSSFLLALMRGCFHTMPPALGYKEHIASMQNHTCVGHACRLTEFDWLSPREILPCH